MSRRKFTYEDYLKIKALKEQGLRFRDIGPKVGISSSMCSVIHRHGHNLPAETPVHFNSVRSVISRETGEELFQHDPYYKF